MPQQQHYTSQCATKEQHQDTKGYLYNKKAEKALLNERVRTINNMINMFSWQINTCIEELENKIKKEDMEECYKFIDRQRETRHLKTQKRQQEKFWRLCQRNTGGCSNHAHSSNGTGGHSNPDTIMPPLYQQQNNSTPDTTQEQTQYNNNQNWVRKLSKRPLTKAQEKILSHGPNYAIVTKELPIGECIDQVEKVCQNIKQGEAEELRGEVKIIRKKIKPPKSNISKEEARAIKELKKDQERMVLTADKGVSMVVMDRKDYEKKSEELLSQSTYTVLPSCPTRKQKNKLITLLKTIKAEGGISHTIYKRLYPTGEAPPNIMVYQKFTKRGSP